MRRSARLSLRAAGRSVILLRVALALCLAVAPTAHLANHGRLTPQQGQAPDADEQATAYASQCALPVADSPRVVRGLASIAPFDAKTPGDTVCSAVDLSSQPCSGRNPARAERVLGTHERCPVYLRICLLTI